MNSFSRGVRNAFRNGIRTISVTLILALAIGLALAMLVARQAVQTKIDSVQASIGNNITITPAGMRAFGGMGFGGGFERSNSTSDSSSNSSQGNTLTTADLTKIKNVAHVASASATLTVRATSGTDTNLTSPTPTFNRGNELSSSDSSSAAQITGFKMPIALAGVNNPSQLASTLGNIKLSSGDMIDGTSSNDEAVVGDQLATQNNLKVGSTFTLYGKTITVKGILASSDSTSSNSTNSNSGQPRGGRNMSIGSVVVLPLSTLQTLSGQSGTINSIIATVDNVNNTDAAVTAITSTLGTDSNGNNIADVTSDKANAQTTIDSLASIKTTSTISLIACGVAAAVIIFLAMLMVVRERRNEIGVLKAIGAKGKTIITQFVAESLVLTLLAVIIGLGVGIVAATPLTNTLVSSSNSSSQQDNGMPTGGGSNGVQGSTSNGQRPNFAQFANRGSRAISDVVVKIDWTIVLYALGVAVITAAVGATAASVIAMKVRPAEAVRAE
ncbi:FtsX-like permease family protein [Candidatus Saccharibacteria bacterium]|nr:FtsX-like permease family protein [Candidatus Saccharibacteria bacterium]